MPTFAATIVEADRGGAYVEVPPHVVDALGGGGRIPVSATFDGVPYRGSVVSMGDAKVLGLLKGIRSRLGKVPGDVVAVSLERDEGERTVVVPDDLRSALDGAGVTPAFAALSYSRRRELVMSIEQARRPETRARRIAQAVERARGSPGDAHL